MVRLSLYVRNLIVKLHLDGKSTVQIQRKLHSIHDVQTTRQSVRLFLNRYHKFKTVNHVRRSSSFQKIHKVHRLAINMWMSRNSEMSNTDIAEKLQEIFDVTVSSSYVSKLKKQLKWTTKRMQYCQLITHINKLKRKQWCLRSLHKKEDFENVIFVDESTIELSSNGRIYYYQKGSELQHLPAKKAKPKHSYKVHVWGGISYRGATDICIFSGIMDSLGYQRILNNNLLPFAEARFPDGYRLYQDNDSKHTSKSTKKWMEEKNVLDKVMETPASSPDLNPIENLWGNLKDHLQTKIKPKTKEELVNGIKTFWTSLSVEKCGRFIDHIHKVIPVVILNDGGPTEF